MVGNFSKFLHDRSTFNLPIELIDISRIKNYYFYLKDFLNALWVLLLKTFLYQQ